MINDLLPALPVRLTAVSLSVWPVSFVHPLFAALVHAHPGCAVGIIIGFILISPSSTTYDLPAQLSLLLGQYDFPSLADGLRRLELDWTRLESEWQNIKSMIPEPWKLANDGREFQV